MSHGSGHCVSINPLFYKIPVQQTIPFEEGTFFITFTCHKWMNLIETTDSYDLLLSNVSRYWTFLNHKPQLVPGRLSTGRFRRFIKRSFLFVFGKRHYFL
jgi:hypothetical protein